MSVKASLNELLEKAKDAKTQKKVKEEVAKGIKKGREAIARLQAEINKPAFRAKAAAQVKRAKEALAHLKQEAIKRERQAVAYAKKNPEKALVIGVAAGAAAIALLAVLRKRARA